MDKRILIPLEGKPTDEAAISHAVSIARERPANLTLLQVITIAADGPGGLGKQFQMEAGSSGWRRERRAKELLASLERRLQLAGVAVETALVVGDRSEADEIVVFAHEQGFDLIVMAADGRPWWKRALFGCPSDGVLHKSLVPALFVNDGTRRQRVARREKVAGHPVMAMLGSASL